MNAMMKMTLFTCERPVFRVFGRKVKGMDKIVYW